MENNAIVTSPAFSCGLGLVIDVFLALGIKTDLFGDHALGHWINTSEDSWQLSPAGLHHLRHHSILANQKSDFVFHDGKSIMFEHNPLLLKHSGEYKKTVLMVRNPVDAVYSWHRRYKMEERGVSFSDYIGRFTYFNDHFPYDLFQAPPLEIYSLYCAFWIGAVEDIKIVRYEDLKADILPWLDLVESIGVQRSKEEISEALLQVSNGGTSVGQTYRETNVKGQVFEYKSRMTQVDHDQLLSATPNNQLAKFLGYVEGDVKKSELFDFDNRVLDLIKEAVNILCENQGRDELVHVESYLNVINQAVGENVAAVLKVDRSNGFSLNRGDVDVLRSLSSVTRFLQKLYGEEGQEKISTIGATLANLTGFMAKSAPNPNMAQCFQDRMPPLGFFIP